MSLTYVYHKNTNLFVPLVPQRIQLLRSLRPPQKITDYYFVIKPFSDFPKINESTYVIFVCPSENENTKKAKYILSKQRPPQEVTESYFVIKPFSHFPNINESTYIIFFVHQKMKILRWKMYISSKTTTTTGGY
jgi:hypothetical protein